MSLASKLSLILKAGLLLLGLTIPSSVPVVITNSLAAGLLSSVFFKKSQWSLLLFILGVVFVLGNKNSWPQEVFFLTCFLMLIGFFLGSFLKQNLRIIFLMVVLTLGYLFIAAADGKDIRRAVQTEPVYDRYTTDMRGYLKAYFLIEKGEPFYSSYALSEKGDASSDSYPGEIWGWKTPFLFYLWKLVPGTDGRSIYWLFCLLVTTIPMVSFLTAEKLMGKELACLSAFLVWPYFLMPLKELTFIQVEWWGLIFFLMGFYFLLRKNNLFSFFFLLLAVFSRELYFVHLASLLALFIFKKDKSRIFILSSIFIIMAVFYFFVHIPQVARFENLNSLPEWLRLKGESSWFSFNSWPAVRAGLAFNSWQYLLFSLFPFRLTLIFSVLGVGGAYFKTKRLKYLLALMVFFPFFLFQFRSGLTTLKHDYWGIYYVPFTLLFCSSLLFLLRKKRR